MLPPEPCHWTCPFVVLCLGAHVFLQIKSSDSMIICAGEKVCLLSVSPEEQAHFNPKDRPWLPEDLKQAKRYSRRFQWLPCNVSLNETYGCRITSYTNNLPPLGQPTAVWRHQGNYHSAYTTMRLDIKFCSKEIVASSLQSCRIPWGSLRCGFITRRSLYSNAAKNPRIWSPKCDGRNDQSKQTIIGERLAIRQQECDGKQYCISPTFRYSWYSSHRLSRISRWMGWAYIWIERAPRAKIGDIGVWKHFHA